MQANISRNHLSPACITQTLWNRKWSDEHATYSIVPISYSTSPFFILHSDLIILKGVIYAQCCILTAFSKILDATPWYLLDKSHADSIAHIQEMNSEIGVRMFVISVELTPKEQDSLAWMYPWLILGCRPVTVRDRSPRNPNKKKTKLIFALDKTRVRWCRSHRDDSWSVYSDSM